MNRHSHWMRCRVSMDSRDVDETKIDAVCGPELEELASQLLQQLDDPALDPSAWPVVEARAQATALLALASNRPLIAAKLRSMLGYRYLIAPQNARLQDAVVYLTDAVDLMRDRREPEADLIFALSSMYLATTYARVPVSEAEAIAPAIADALRGAADRLPADDDPLRARYLSLWGDVVAHSRFARGLSQTELERVRKEAVEFLAVPERGGALRYLVAFTAGVTALRLGALFDARVMLRKCYDGAVTAGDDRTVARVLKWQADAARSRGRGHGVEAADLLNESGAVYNRLQDPTEAADAYRAAGMLYLENSEWGKAADAFRASHDQAERSLLMEDGDIEAGSRTFRRSGALQALAFSLARQGDAAGAAEAADRARAWRFRAMPRVGSVQFQHALDHLPALAGASLALHKRILDAERRGGEVGEAPDEHAIARLTGIGAELVELRTELKVVQERMARVPGAAASGDPSRLDRIQDALPRDAVGVYLMATRYSGLAILIRTGSVTTLALSQLTDDSLSAHLGAVSEAYDAVRGAGQNPQPAMAWDALMESTCQWLWSACMGPIVDAAAGAQRVVLFPSDGLDFLPLHAAWHETGSTREYVIDRVAVSYALCADLQPQVPPAADFPSQHAVVIGNPHPTSAPPLEGAALEANAIGSGFGSHEILLQSDATIENVMASIPEADILHLVCHAITRFERPYASYMLLAFDRQLTLSDIVEVPLTKRPSVFLSACETSLHDFQNADEVQSLSSAFLAAGARDVIATLWSIDDVSAIMVAARIYDARFRGVPGPEALRAAQCWMRDTPKAQKATDIAAFMWMEPEARAKIAALVIESTADHSRPQHWAAHVYWGAP